MKKLFIIFFVIIALPITQFVFLATSNYEIPQFVDLIHNSSNRNNNLDQFLNEIKISSVYNAQDHIGLQDSVWENGLTGKNITVVVIDTGIFGNHSAFTNDGKLNWSDRIIKYFDLITNTSNIPQDDNGHGTWVASILGGNCSDYQGVAPGVNLVVLRIFDSSGETNSSVFEKAINWVLQNKNIYNIRIVSMSFGAKPEADNLLQIAYLQQIVRKLVDNGILVLAAAGNDGSTLESGRDGTINTPASDKKVVAVGGVDYDGEMYQFSSGGPSFEFAKKPDVCAPAVSIYGADIDFPDDYAFGSGTSGATPFVAGLAALMLEKKETLTPLQLKNILSLTSYKTINPRIYQDNIQGWGVIQGYAALESLNSPVLINDSTEIAVSLTQNYTVFCLPIRLKPNDYYFELLQLNIARAEMYLYKMEPNEYGMPNLVSHTVNRLIQESSAKRMGAFTATEQNYFLVVKSIQRGTGSFLIRLVIEYRNFIFIFLFGISLVSLVYIGKLSINLKNREKLQ
ncbi:MAG: S8 family serine peptidase [Candidatus Lokiarchaeota archaeon]|nr:S8 family serine peptidase [Candidatus Lokiarchaeota archaeon]